MFQTNTALWERFAPLLKRVEKPSRYLGQEWGAVEPDEKPRADYHAVLIYPDTYEIGQANQAIAILYDALNADERIYCERAYLPWVDMIAAMRERALPLASLETFTPLSEFDFVGITLPHELAATNILETLDLGGIPLRSDERGADDPIVFGGGPCAYNPEPYAPFFDVIFIGEGEEMDLEVALLHRELKAASASRADMLRAFAQVPGVYVPSLYEVEEHELACADGVQHYTTAAPAADDVAPVIVKRVIQDFDATKPLPDPIVPYGELVHDRLAIEILRGCNRGCRFCQAGMIYRPVRERSADEIVAATMTGLACTGYDEVSLTSLSSTDHSSIAELLRRNGYPPDALEDRPACPRCGDTGWVGAEMCSCLRALCTQEQIQELSKLLDLGEQSFDTFSLDYYSDRPWPGESETPRERMDFIRDVCYNYATKFPKFIYRNLFLTGAPGLGKTFLSACIARTVSERGYSVVYDTAVNIFARFEEQKFARDQEEARDARDETRRYLQCDLLILDDLGSEMTTPFVQSALYTLINGRLTAQRRTVISSNLSMDEVRRRYSAQSASRLEGEYRVLPFYGEDIRLLRKGKE